MVGRGEEVKEKRRGKDEVTDKQGRVVVVAMYGITREER